MKFTPLAVEDTPTNYLLSAGTYPVQVLDAEEGVSKAGNPQIKLKLRVQGDGQSITVFDYLGATSKKLRNFCQNMQLLEKYKQGEISDLDCANKRGYAEVKIEKNETYGDQNKIAFYVSKPKSTSDTQANAKVDNSFLDEDVPF